MKKLLKAHISVPDSTQLVGIMLLAGVYWATASVLNLYTTQRIDILYQLFPTDAGEIYPRLIVLCFFTIFASHYRFTINEREKQAKEALTKSEKKYRSILESMEEGYAEIDLKGNFTFFNDSLSRILGYSRKELMSMNNREYTKPETGWSSFMIPHEGNGKLEILYTAIFNYHFIF